MNNCTIIFSFNIYNNEQSRSTILIPSWVNMVKYVAVNDLHRYTNAHDRLIDLVIYDEVCHLAPNTKSGVRYKVFLQSL